MAIFSKCIAATLRSRQHSWRYLRVCSFSSSASDSSSKASTDAAASSSGQSAGVLPPTTQQLRAHWMNAAVPMVGFGMMDNFIMIQAGDLIDNTIGVSLGLSTLAAAAGGQVCSDFSGVCFGGVIEAIAMKLGLPSSGLTEEQLRLRVVKNVGLAGAAIGVVFGCCIGATTLLFMDLEKSERLKRQAELATLFHTVMDHGHKLMGAQIATLWLVEPDRKHVSTRAIKGSTKSGHVNLHDVFDRWDEDGTGLLNFEELKHGLWKMQRKLSDSEVQDLVNKLQPKVPNKLNYEEFTLMLDLILHDEYVAPLTDKGIKGRVVKSKQMLNIKDMSTSGRGGGFAAYSGLSTKTLLVSPVISSEGEVIAIVEMVNKQSPDGETIPFSDNDERLIEMLSVHCAIFIENASG